MCLRKFWAYLRGRTSAAEPARGRRRRIRIPDLPAVEAGGYPDGLDHLGDELRRIDYLLRAALLVRAARTGPDLRAELSADYETPLTGATPLGRLQRSWDRCQALAQELRARIDHRVRQTPAALTLPLVALRERFGLTGSHADALLLALSGELDPRVARWYRVLQADDRRSEPSAGLIRAVLTPVHSPAATAGLFDPDGPLVGGRLVRVGGPGDDAPASRHAVRVEPRVAGFLLSAPDPDPLLAAALTRDDTPVGWADLRLSDDPLEAVHHLAAWWGRVRTEPGVGLTVWLQAPAGSDTRAAARAVCTHTGDSLLVVDVPAALRAERWADAVGAAFREARMTRSAILWEGLDPALAGDGAADRLAVLVAEAERFAGLTFVVARAGWDPVGRFRSPTHPFARVDIPPLGYADRRAAWLARLRTLPDVQTVQAAVDQCRPNPPIDISDGLATRLANSFQLTEGQMADAVAAFRGLRLLHTGPTGPAPDSDPAPPPGVVPRTVDELPAGVRRRIEAVERDLFDACRRQFAHRLVSYARRISPGPAADWDRLVVPGPIRQQLRELSDRVTRQGRVYGELGFARHLSLGRGLVVLFAGPSGTGKTMAASILAGRQGVDLYQVDLAAVVSKWVGETEQHLDRVLSEAEAANAFVFFDEADCLFGKRGEVREARDRWANLQVNYLLQRIEEFTGTVILATNYRQNIDEAFLRRIHAVVEFPAPDAAARLAILKVLFPATVTPPPDGQLQQVAARFPLSGGSLKNVVLDATFRAAGGPDRRPQVELKHLVAGVAREYQKLGKPITQGDFGPDFYRYMSDAFYPGAPAPTA